MKLDNDAGLRLLIVVEDRYARGLLIYLGICLLTKVMPTTHTAPKSSQNPLACHTLQEAGLPELASFDQIEGFLRPLLEAAGLGEIDLLPVNARTILRVGPNNATQSRTSLGVGDAEGLREIHLLNPNNLNEVWVVSGLPGSVGIRVHCLETDFNGNQRLSSVLLTNPLAPTFSSDNRFTFKDMLAALKGETSFEEPGLSTTGAGAIVTYEGNGISQTFTELRTVTVPNES